MALTDRDLRNLINTKQDSVEFRGIPSANGMVEGQTAIQKKSNSQLAIYRKKFGKLWKSYMSSDGNQYVDRNLNVIGRTKSRITAKDLVFDEGPELTIDTGKITITHSFHTVDTESDASSDNLDQIIGGENGQILILKPANAGRTVVVRSGIRNIYTSGDTSFSMDDGHDTSVLMNHDSDWYLILSTSIAGA
jgi:hypothetical protein